MNKHLSMLFAVAFAVLAAPAYASCPVTTPASTCLDVTTTLKSPIATATADGTGKPDNIFIAQAGGVAVSTGSAAVTVNSNNYLTNDGTISNNNSSNAAGIVIDAGGGTIDTTALESIGGPFGVNQNGSLNLTGSGTGKVGIELTDGKMIGPISLDSSSIVKIHGDGSTGIAITPTGILQAVNNNPALLVNGTITMTPSHASALTNATPSSIMNLEAGSVVNGNVETSPTAILSNSGAGATGIILSGSICDITGCTSGTNTNLDNGTFINTGTIDVSGLSTTTKSKGLHPEGGSAVIVAGTIEGGFVNEGPTTAGAATSAALIAGNGFTSVSGGAESIAAVLSIAPTPTTVGAITIGPDQFDPSGVDSSYSVVNYGVIRAQPTNSNESTTAVNVQGLSQTALTTLTGGFYSSGIITAVADSTQGSASATNVGATALLFNDWAKVPAVEISGVSNGGVAGSTLGTVSASISGGEGGKANAIVFTTKFNGGSPNGLTNVGTTVLKVDQFAKVIASATTINPKTVQVLDAVAVLDQSGTLSEIDNGGTISATVSSLTGKPGVNFQNFARAIDLQAGSSPVSLYSSGTIVGDVLMNGAGGTSGNPTIVSVGGGSATGSTDANQVTAANETASKTGVVNTGGNQATLTGDLSFGTGTSALYVNDFGTVSGGIVSKGLLDVGIAASGDLNVLNNAQTGQMVVNNFHDYGGTLLISVNETLRQNDEATIVEQTQTTPGMIVINAGLHGLRPAFTSFVPQGTPATCAVAAENCVTYVLASSPVFMGNPTLTVTNLAGHQQDVENSLPYYFNADSDCITGASTANCSMQFLTTPGGQSELVLNLRPKTAAQLGLTGEAKTMFPFVNAALTASKTNLLPDDALGAAIIKGIVNPASAEKVFSQFAPDVSGNERAIAISLTDEATGPVAARQRTLRMYANQGGDFTLWGEEYAQFIDDKGTEPAGGLSNFKDHGFGFTLGADVGDPKDGWYGAALTFFNGDATEVAPRNAKAEDEWFMLTGYTDWRGRHLFLDTQASVGLGNIKGKRFLVIADPNGSPVPLAAREADSKRSGLLGALGATTGAVFNFGSLVVMPEISLDGMTMREEGYTETGGGNGGNGDGFDLVTKPYYATSLRTFLGADSRIDVDLGSFVLQPEARLGYRFDFLNDPVKVRAAFASDPNDTFQITGPDPSRGNVVAGATIGASTDTWSMGVNFDWVRGSNGSTNEVGTFTLLGRI